MNGASDNAAKKPSTTVGIPARISSSGLAQARTRGEAYSARKIAAYSPIGAATSIAMVVIRSVPTTSGTIPKAPEEPP